MPRCCGGATCSCLIQNGQGIVVAGSGTAQDPYVITADFDFSVLDNTTFNLSLGGTGTVADPYVLAVGYASTAKLGDIPNVNTPAPANGQVLGWDSATNKWTARNPTTAASGSVLHDTSLTGDGSAGTPLAARHNATGFTQTTATGIGLTDDGKRNLVLHYADAATRSADTLTPAINTVSMLDNNPGQQDYWTGSQWVPVTNGIDRDLGPEFMAISGSYDGISPVTLVTRQVTVTTDTLGYFDVLGATDLASAAGVLTCHFQETGVVPFKAMVVDNINAVGGYAYRLDTGEVYASQAISGIVTAYIY